MQPALCSAPAGCEQQFPICRFRDSGETSFGKTLCIPTRLIFYLQSTEERLVATLRKHIKAELFPKFQAAGFTPTVWPIPQFVV